MNLLTEPTGLEETINSRRRSTHQVISKLYEAEIIGQTLHVGRLHEYPRYKKAMREVGSAIDSLQILLTDTLQLARLDTVRSLLQEKERNMRSVLEALRQNPTDELYRQQLDSLISQQDSLLSNATRVKRKVITHHNSYTIHHKKKGFFKRLKDVFAPGKEDSTQVSNVVQEVFTDTIDEIYSPVDTIANMLTGIHDKVLQPQQQQQRTLNARTNRLRIAGSNLSKRVNQLLESIELDEQSASHKKLEQELYIRNQAAWTMATISILAVILVLVFFAIIWRDITRSNHYRKELEKAMEVLQMDPSYADRDLNVGFSGGEKKKAEILQLLMLEPSLTILDETDSGLDVDAVRTVSAGIEAYRRKCGGSLLIITHSTKILESLMVDQTHIMVEGEIVKTGDASLVEEINRDGFGKYEKSLA